MKVMNNSRKAKRGAALVEYGLIVAGVALVAAAAVSVFGHKTAGMIAASAAILPGAQSADNGPITAGHVIDVAPDASGNITIDTTGTNSLGSNLGLSQGQVDSLVTEPPQ